MWYNPRSDCQQSTPSSDNRRRSGRIHQETLQCSLGEVLDLSATGMRVIARKVPKGTFSISVEGISENLRIECEVMWSKRKSFWKHEIGLRFVNVDRAITEKLTKVSTENRLRRHLHTGDLAA